MDSKNKNPLTTLPFGKNGDKNFKVEKSWGKAVYAVSHTMSEWHQSALSCTQHVYINYNHRIQYA